MGEGSWGNAAPPPFWVQLFEEDYSEGGMVGGYYVPGQCEP